MKVDVEKMTAEINLMENATYIVKDGQLILVPKPPKGFGKQIINWNDGKPCHGTLEQSFKF